MANFSNLATFTLGLGGKWIPKELRCTAPVSFTGADTAGPSTPMVIDLSANQNNNANFIEAALTIYIDNGGQAGNLIIDFASGQRIYMQANTQGYFPILQPNPIRFTAFSNAPTTAYCQLVNAILPTGTWSAASLLRLTAK